MTFISGKVYTHKYFKDVDVLVTRSRSYEKGWELDVVWVTKYGGRLLKTDAIFIDKDAYPYWREVGEC